MDKSKMQIVIMAGGSGSRLWPVSRSMYPKQFQSLTESRTMLQVTAQRVGPLTDQKPLLICNEDHRFIAAEQMRGIDTPCEIILEPVGRNTAPRRRAGRVTRDPGRWGRLVTGPGRGPPDPGRETGSDRKSRPRSRSPRPARWSRLGSSAVARDRLWLHPKG